MSGALKVTLELETGIEPIRGLVYADGAAPHRFDGYVQLIGALEGLHTQWGEMPNGSPGQAEAGS